MKKMFLVCGSFVILLTSWTLAQIDAPIGWANAQWVWDEPDANTVAQNNEPRYLRLSFTLSGKPQAAELWITADNVYTAYVNGINVGSDNKWESVEKYDVAKHLVAGKNVLAIKATNNGGVAGAIARLHIKTADKKDVFIVTDEKTKIQRAGSVGDGNWLKADFDDSAWSSAIVLGDPSIAPWNSAVGFVAQGKGKGKKGGGQFGYDTNETVPVKGRLTPEEQIKHFVVPKDFEIELVAADPLVINPITMVMDERGRIIVSESHTYRYGPKGSPIKPYANPVIRLDPDGKGGFERRLVADGFEDPVMGIAVKGEKLWLTANNYLYTYDMPEKLAIPKGRVGQPPIPDGKTFLVPLATNKKTIVTDLNKAWNPFGMFVLEWGPDGKLYMSVGNHPINLQGPEKQKTSGRGSSGIIVRMEPDGSKMERLVHGLRVPYSFEYDPFGQLWLLSNGEGNPNRFVRVIDGVDYHCYSRGAVDNNWLAGNHPLAPPCEEIHRGADTQLMRYYGAAYPAEYWGNLFLCNWGAHGFAGPNRGIFRFVPDERNNIVKREPLVWCKDPHFRPAHIILDQDGSLLIADWYGRDDESDMTGRIWRLKYVGKDRPVVKHKLDAPEWKNDDYAISALGSPSHLIREKAMSTIVGQGRKFDLRKLSSHAAKSADPLGAANAIWSLVQIRDGFPLEVYGGTVNPDWKVRRLAIHIGRRYDPASAQRLAEGSANGSIARLLKDKDVAVRIESALALADADAVRFTLTDALMKGAASDRHLRYEAAWRLAHFADDAALIRLLTSDDADVRLAGLIAIDVACYENFPTKRVALEVLAKALVDPRKLDHQLLLDVARLDGDASIVPALEKLIARDDVPAATVAKAFLILKAKAGPAYAVKAQGAGKRFIEAVEKGTLPIKTTTDQLVLFEFLESEGPTPFALKQIGGQLQSSNRELKQAAHTLARRFGEKAGILAPPLYQNVRNPNTKFEDAIDNLSTYVRIGNGNSRDYFEDYPALLNHPDRYVRSEVVRWWRHFSGNDKMAAILAQAAPKLIVDDADIKEDLATVFKSFGGAGDKFVKSLSLPAPETDKNAIAKYALDELAKMPDADRTKRAAMGLQVFERNACTKCHTTATATTLLAPSLKGIAQQKLDYLIESVLYPSKIIKTGWEVETIATKDGKVITGLVKDEGKSLRVIQAMDYLGKHLTIDKASIDERGVTKISLMPDGQEATLSRREFVDLIAYLQTLK